MGRITITDHEGNVFNSRKELCDYWNIPVNTYESRKSRKWSMKDILTTPKGRNPANQTYIDHKGNKFYTLTDMAKYWNIPDSTLQRRLATMHMPIEEALTMTNADIKKYYQHSCIDHKGNRFESKAQMCEFYKIPRHVYFGRKSIGWTDEQALTTPVNSTAANFKSITYKNKYYKTVSAFCNELNLTRSTFNLRVKQMKEKYNCDNLTDDMIDEILAMPTKNIKINKQKCIDFDGNEFPSINAMCRHYGITRATYSSRIENHGWDQKRALTEKLVINACEVTDYAGNVFPTKADMAHYYGLPKHSFQGKNIDETKFKRLLITSIMSKKLPNIQIKELIEFPYFLVKIKNKDYVMTFEKLLNIYHNDDFYPIHDTKIQDENLIINDCIEFPYYNVTFNNQKLVWTYWQIINYRKDSNFGLSTIAM